MKKFSILILAAALMASCGYKPKTITLETEADSINYALGVMYSTNIGDSTDEAIKEFLDAVKAGYKGDFDKVAPTALVGLSLGIDIRQYETEGLVNQPQLTLNAPIYMQAIVNTWLEDTTTLSMSKAQMLLQMPPAEGLQYETVPAKKCPSERTEVELNNYMDSVNYAFGMMATMQIKPMLEQVDTITPTEEIFNTLIANINKGLKLKVNSAQTYLGGRQFGATLKKFEEDSTNFPQFPDVPLDFDIIFQGLINGAYNYEDMMTREETNTYLNEKYMTRQFGDWKQENLDWLAANAKKDSIQTTASGLQYKVVREGKGEKPTAIDTVKVHYEGKLINDTVFDSSYRRGAPIEFPLNGVIAGWTEGLQLMTPGSEYIFYIPQELGYGERGSGGLIKPYSALVFRVELLEVKKAKVETGQPAQEDLQIQMIN